MKVLQTLGRHGAQEGIFQYRRDAEGVLVDASVGRTNLQVAHYRFSHQEWLDILLHIRSAPQASFRLTIGHGPPNQSLYTLLSDAVPSPAASWTWNDSIRSYVCAILEHEGSVDLYGGALGPHNQALIVLARDT